MMTMGKVLLRGLSMMLIHDWDVPTFLDLLVIS